MTRMQGFVKRTLDLLVAVCSLMLLSPVLLLIALAIRLDSPGPAIYRQPRLGKGGRPFTIYKFRTMFPGAAAKEIRDEQGGTIVPADDPRITPLGRVLRSWSLDELPQLWNVLIGEMSLVGPRPDQAHDISLYSERDWIKLRTKPGMTSLAVIKGRNEIPWRERMEWDIRYVEQYSLRLDFVILLRTVEVVVARRGVFTPEVAAEASLEK